MLPVSQLFMSFDWGRISKCRCQEKILGIQPTTDNVADRCSERLMYPGLHRPGVLCRTAVLCVGPLPPLSVNTQGSFTSSAGSWSLSSLDSLARLFSNYPASAVKAEHKELVSFFPSADENKATLYG